MLPIDVLNLQVLVFLDISCAEEGRLPSEPRAQFSATMKTPGSRGEKRSP